MANVAKFHVHSDDWGYRVFPPLAEPFFAGKGPPTIEVMNHVNANLRVELPPNITVASGSSIAGPNGTVTMVLAPPVPTTEFEVYIYVVADRPEEFRARADSDPRVKPK